MRIFKLVLFIVLLFMPALTWSKGPAGVVNGVHNLSTSGVDPWDGGAGGPGSSLYATNTEQVCVFCHTPHGGSLDAPLWNRQSPSGTFTHYNSATISNDLGLSINRPPGQESLLCLSCHDGSISVNHVTNVPNDLGPGVAIQTWNGEENTEIIDDIITGGPGRRIGGSPTTPAGVGDLSDDHPISFSYADVLASDPYTTGPKGGTLKSVALAENNGDGVEFFGGAAKNVECSTCHDPHVDYLTSGNEMYAPFLIMSNAGSGLCLACHTK